MKGPMTTQTLIGIIGTEPLHWRGDRENLAAFNPAFESLMGDDTQLTPTEMARYEAFVATLTPPPNPFRNIDASLSTTAINGGFAVSGESSRHWPTRSARRGNLPDRSNTELRELAIASFDGANRESFGISLLPPCSTLFVTTGNSCAPACAAERRSYGPVSVSTARRSAPAGHVRTASPLKAVGSDQPCAGTIAPSMSGA